ncbi:MAG TPA: tRNA (adenosine(37)-N6)-threonylcarbamoyltransferase complex dimerization subunit type 1 TsaB [Sphaerochaeta sp.]|jgi:tRNA threonylcarbamoyladenosine biosynthesis protein TsaB|nr:tRNA (adenosine(37)-N6)-threonylcarbamoyltransferase complex dimerization subunit type 1 TsaB [Spirochaetales bacterium]HPX29273.1 tRNA (adenosine(37)-N6)-threonylcarbamoyltransferase complex dimerization subunit type 1 TsaB [Sphaerochaeta sp.]HQB55072.1 tRNA (adenosine(37)-N6)-threonylcarbamoyltransferase complex dimerization subunit type 1 TsaB [Sphaerochaeta sp.]
MKILGCDTSTSTAHLFLGEYKEDRLIWYETTSVVWNNTHSEQLLDRLLRMCDDHSIQLSELDLLCASSGPGSFTGLRIALSTMKGLSLGLNKPLVSVPTLELFQGIARHIGGACLAVIDAKKQRFYTALFVDGIKIGRRGDLALDEIASLIASYPSVTLLGSDGNLLAKRLKNPNVTVLEASFQNLGVELADRARKHYLEKGADPLDQGPTYIRKSDAELALKG